MPSLELRDRLIGHALAGLSLAYLAGLPRYLGWADESYFLYEAKRIRDGEVMYRDIFQFITPLASYAMALLYWIFGTSIATARLAMATLHAVTCGLLYTTCRGLKVRPSLAMVAPLTFLALCQPLWPFTSPHWVSTTLTIAILAVLLRIASPPRERGRIEEGARNAVAPVDPLSIPPASRGRRLPVQAIAEIHAPLVVGVLLGLLIGVQQQKGVLITSGVAAIIMAHWMTDHRATGTLVARFAALAAGIAIVVVPLALWMIGTAGIRPVYEALVVFPLDSYRRGHFIRWGAAAPLTEGFAATTFPALLRWSPLILIPPMLRLARDVVRGHRDLATRQLFTLIILTAASIASIWYFPDLIHIAFIAPLFIVCAAASLEWLVESLPFQAFAGAAVAIVLSWVLGQQLWHNTRTMLQEFTIPHDTAFGRIDFARPWEPMFVDAVRARLDTVPGRELFSYPNVTSIYLTADAHNPTPYQYLLARVSPPAQIENAQRILAARALPYVIVSPMIFNARDPLATYITMHYESAPIQAIVDAGELPSFWLYRRKAGADE